MRNYIIIALLFYCFYGSAQVRITDFNPKSEVPGNTITLTGSGFGATSVENVAYMGSIEATVLSASPTSITLEVPVGAQTGKITVVNTTTNLQSQSVVDFYPSFTGGAQILPASFLPNQELALKNPGRTVRMVDLDGDGWLDLISVSSLEISYFRNRGNGGTLDINSFEPRVDINPGLGAYLDIGYADLDNDGKMDLYFSVDANPIGHIGILRNTSSPGSISFDPVFQINATVRISYVAAGDIDGDGRQEILAGRGASCGAPLTNYFLIFQNQSSLPGTLAFGPQVDIGNTTGACTYERIVIQDINDDGKPDVAVQRSFQSSVSLLLNQSVLGVIDVNSFDISPNLINGASTIALADFDGNDLPELITHNETNNTGIAIHRNSSTLTSLSYSDSIPYNSAIFREGETKVADINGDQKPDIVIAADWSQEWISVLENKVSGNLDATSFGDPVQLETGTIFPKTLDIGDLNNDGKQDIITANQNAFLSFFENANDYAPVITTVSRYQASVGESITIGGMNFGATPSDNKVRFGNVLANVLTASPTSLSVEVPLGSGYDFISVNVGILSDKTPRKFSTRFSSGSGFNATSFAPPVMISASSDVNDLDLGDMDNDGKIDIIHRQGANMRLLRNQSVFNVIDNASFVEVNTNENMNTSPVNLEDLNGDDFMDVVNDGRINRNSSATGIEPIEFEPFVTTGASGTNHIVLADLNNDGLVDIIESTTSTNVRIKESRMRWGGFVQTGAVSESFEFPINLSKAGTNGFMAVADLDGDGWIDIAGTNPFNDNVSIFRNLGSGGRLTPGSFATSIEFPVGVDPRDIGAGDLDLDGKVDLAVSNLTDQTITVFHNQSTPGNLMFDSYTYPIPASPGLVRLHDLDGDTKPEIIVTAAGSFIVLKNNTASIDANSFIDVMQYSLPPNTGGNGDFEIGDLDDDERPDLVFGSSDPDEVVIIKNLLPFDLITIDQDPFDQDICEGDIAQFDVLASGTTNLTYQWQENDGGSGGFTDMFDGTGILGTQTPTLQIFTSTAFLDGYTFRCLISGDNSTDVLSFEAILTINPTPADPTVTDGTDCNPAFVVVTAAGASDGDYRWYDDSMNLIAGEVNSTFTTMVLSTSTDFFVTIDDGICESMPVLVTANILEPVSITSQPQGVTADIDDMITLSVTAIGDNLSYQWQQDGLDISGATSDTYTIGSALASDAGDYTCIVSNICSSETSTIAVVTIGNPGSGFSIIDTDQSQTLTNGQIIPVAFGQTNQFSDLVREFQIRNTSGTTLIINNVISSNPVFSIISSPSSISPAGSDIFEIEMDASNLGLFNADITIDTDAGIFVFPVEGEVITSTGELTIFNALAPDGNGQNDFFKLENIESFSQNTVQIFNRWGDMVFEVENYDNQNSSRRFEGVSNVSGSRELIEGTYFYVIQIPGQKYSGHLFLRR